MTDQVVITPAELKKLGFTYNRFPEYWHHKVSRISVERIGDHFMMYLGIHTPEFTYVHELKELVRVVTKIEL